MAELLLPEAVRRKAAVSVGGEHAWRQQDVEEVLNEARVASLGCLGGRVQFQTREGICEAYWLNFDPQPQRESEPWSDYVSRSTDQALEGFRRVCRETDFRSVAGEWELTLVIFQHFQHVPPVVLDVGHGFPLMVVLRFAHRDQ